jgi:hypothetical protein
MHNLSWSNFFQIGLVLVGLASTGASAQTLPSDIGYRLCRLSPFKSVALQARACHHASPGGKTAVTLLDYHHLIAGYSGAILQGIVRRPPSSRS